MCFMHLLNQKYTAKPHILKRYINAKKRFLACFQIDNKKILKLRGL